MNALRESDSTGYDLPRVHMMPAEEAEPIERDTTMQILNKKMATHPVWSGALVGIIVAASAFVGVTFMNSHDMTVEQPLVDNMQNYRLGQIEEDVGDIVDTCDDMKTEQMQQMIILVKIAERLNVEVPSGD